MSKTILLVDDADVFLHVERMIFQRTGARILTAKSGTEAMEIAIREKPEIVLLDLVLPDIPGDRVCKQIKNHPATAGTSVIMVTAFGRPAEEEKCRLAGCDGFVTKPVKYAELIARVAQLLGVDKRHSMRVLVRVDVQADAHHESFFGTSTDLSKSGMFLEADRRLGVNEEITLRFFLPGQHQVAVRGRIVREDLSEGIGYGIRFLQSEPALERFIESKARP